MSPSYKFLDHAIDDVNMLASKFLRSPNQSSSSTPSDSPTQSDVDPHTLKPTIATPTSPSTTIDDPHDHPTYSTAPDVVDRLIPQTSSLPASHSMTTRSHHDIVKPVTRLNIHVNYISLFLGLIHRLLMTLIGTMPCKKNIRHLFQTELGISSHALLRPILLIAFGFFKKKLNVDGSLARYKACHVVNSKAQ